MKRNGFGILATLFLLPMMVRAETPATQNAVLNKIGFDQNLNAQVPLTLLFSDESGATVPLSRYFGEKPVVLSLVYYECPMLCTEALNGLVRALRALNLTAGQQFEVVTVSFNPRETAALAAAKKKAYLSRYGRSGAEKGWAFLTGKEDAIHALTQAVGFRYAYDASMDQYAHATGLVVLTPTGKVSRYLFGVEYSAKDLRLALIDASGNKIGSLADKLLLFCYHYDPATGKYGLAILRIVRIAGLATLIVLGGIIIVLLRREKTS